MNRCSEKAFATCPTRHLCGTREEATFTDDSECAAFNKAVEEKPMTNAERIRAMSDEELAMVIMCPYSTDPEECIRPEERCFEWSLKWLRDPATGGGFDAR